ncbi:MAG: alpha-ribazole phosphatase [Lutibacter sp.]|nr:alpha-ribazole phosphatase [Lutibacter sp.]
MEIYLVRHTTPAIEKGVCYGQTDLNVAETFEEEVELVLKNLEDRTHSKVFTSPLIRCKKLALKISNQITEDDRLKEINFGDWELLKWDDIDRNELDVWMKDYVNIEVPNGESCLQLFDRNIAFFKEIIQLKHPKTIIVCHAGVIRSILSYINNTNIEDSYNIAIDYGQVFKIQKENNIFTLNK